VYANLPRFFALAEIPAAHEALKYWLWEWEELEKAQPWLNELSPGARATIHALMARHIEPVRAQLLDAIRADSAELAALRRADRSRACVCRSISCTAPPTM
jgi:hypothetical protein